MRRELLMVSNRLSIGTSKRATTFNGKLRFLVWDTRVQSFGAIEFLLQPRLAAILIPKFELETTALSIPLMTTPSTVGKFFVWIAPLAKYCGRARLSKACPRSSDISKVAKPIVHRSLMAESLLRALDRKGCIVTTSRASSFGSVISVPSIQVFRLIVNMNGASAVRPPFATVL